MGARGQPEGKGDQSRGVFRGRVLVRPDAQKTDAQQSNPNLLLTDRAELTEGDLDEARQLAADLRRLEEAESELEAGSAG